jgi:hypothetical protein
MGASGSISAGAWAGIVFAAYFTISAILFCFPGLVHKKRTPPPVKVRLGAHRGGSAERPENTIMAFQHAVDCGMELLELDCYLTKDKQVVLDSLFRITRRSAYYIFFQS